MHVFARVVLGLMVPMALWAQAGRDAGPSGSAVVTVEAVATPILQETQADPLEGAVDVVSSEQIQDLNAQDLPSALRMTPGIVISRHNPVGSFGGAEGGSIFVRGMGASRPGAEIQMLVDGVPKFVSIWTHPLMDVLSVDNADQIEVHKGAQPVLFGGGAFGAVNLVTKSMHEDGYYTSLESAIGSFRTGEEVIKHGGRSGDFDYYAVQSYRRSDGQRAGAGGEVQDYFGRVGYRFSDHWRTSLVCTATNNWADDPGPVDGSVLPQGRFKTNDFFAVATLSNQCKGAEGYLKLYSDDGHIRWGGQPNDATGLNNAASNTDYDNFGARFRETFKPWKGAELILGSDLDFVGGKTESLAPPDPPNQSGCARLRIFAPYAALSQQFGRRDDFYLTPSMGVRIMSHSQFGSKAGPQAGLVAGFKDTEFHAMVSRGVNFPGLYAEVIDEMFMPGDNHWRDLKPESLNHSELGVSHRIGTAAKLEFTVFRDEGRDRIVTIPPPPFPPRWSNFGTWRTQGVEASATLAPTRDLAIFMGATYLDKDPQDLPYTPRKSASAGFNYRILDRLQISMDGMYMDGQTVASRDRSLNTMNYDRVSAYAVLNAKVSCDLILSRPYAGKLFLALENLGDRKYEQKKGYPMPGINGSLGFKIQF